VFPFAAGISTDTVTEKTADTGVTLDSVLLKDGRVDTTQGADIVCAATINLETATGNVVDVTGSTGPVTAITLSQGHWRVVRFTGTPTLTNGASLILPGASDIVAAAGDYGIFAGYAGSVVRCLGWFRAAISPTGFTTGDVKLTIKTTADAGWVMMNDGTIGNAASGGTTRANADTLPLFTLLYNNTADADCAVSGGRGANAAADYAANKTIALPKALGRALAGAGAGSGLTSRALAKAAGAEDAINVAHTHTITDPGHVHTGGMDNTVNLIGGGSGAFVHLNTQPLPNTGSATTGISIDSSGASGTGANLQPTVFLNVMIKL
jgi:hypothetical protein